MSWKLNEITTSSHSPPPSVTASDPRPAPSTPSYSSQLLNFKRGTKRDISAYSTLKDEKYYESIKSEVSPPEESLPYTTTLTLLQTAVHHIPELRMVETMEEFISLSFSTPGPTMGYDNYLTLLQNACIRYDSNLKSRPYLPS